jgi:hypothetical protein
MVVGSLTAVPAQADWSQSVQVGSGHWLDLAMARTGDTALAFQELPFLGFVGTYLTRRPVGGTFSPAQLVDAGGALEGLAFPDPAAVLEWSADGRSVDTQIQPSAGASLEAPEVLVPDESLKSHGDAHTATTSRGDVIAGLLDDPHGDDIGVLPFGAAKFIDEGHTPCPTDQEPLVAVDDAGGADVATGGDCKRVEIFYRAFTHRFAPGRLVGGAPVSNYAVGAAGRGHAALLEQYGGFHAVRVGVVLGHDGRFGRLHRLGGVQRLGGPVYGDVVSRSGDVTLGWGGCRLGLSECTVFTSRGNATGRFGATEKLATSSPRSWVSAAIGPGTVALQRCPHPGSRCTIAVGFAAPGYRFTRAKRLTSDGRIAQLASDSGGDEVIVWSTSAGSLWAAVRMAGQSRFGAGHRLAPPGTRPQNVSAAIGHHREAVVAWNSQSDLVSAASYTAGP